MINCYWWTVLRFYLSTCWEGLKKCKRNHRIGRMIVNSEPRRSICGLFQGNAPAFFWMKGIQTDQSMSQIHVQYFLQWESVQYFCVLVRKFHEAILPCSKTFYLIILFVQTVHSTAYFVLCLQYCDKKVEVHFVTGDHVTLLDSKECATIINQHVMENEAVLFKKSIMSEGNKWCRPSRTT